jgi:uncharacterized delta-60 repeat protein
MHASPLSCAIGIFSSLLAMSQMVAAAAHPFYVDPTFQPEIDPVQDDQLGLFCVGVKSNGAIVVGGQYTTLDGWDSSGIGQLLPSGRRDPDFRCETMIVHAVLPLADGRIVVGGEFHAISWVERRNVAILKADGTLDQTFDSGNITVVHSEESVERQGAVFTVATQPDGKFLVGGRFTNGVLRLNADGSRDTNFDARIEDGDVRALAVTKDGGILVGGYFATVNGVRVPQVARLTTSGELDQTFTSPFISDDPPDDGVGADDIVLQPNGAIFVAGLLSDGRVYSYARLSPRGRLLHGETVQLEGEGQAPARGRAILQARHGRLLVGGDKFFRQLSPTGRNRTPAGYESPNGAVRGIAFQPDGKVIVVGTFTTFMGADARGAVRIGQRNK